MAAVKAVMFLAILSSCLAANFVMFPMFGRSHYMFVARLGQELAERGHQVCKFIGDKLLIRATRKSFLFFELPRVRIIGSRYPLLNCNKSNLNETTFAPPELWRGSKYRVSRNGK